MWLAKLNSEETLYYLGNVIKKLGVFNVRARIGYPYHLFFLKMHSSCHRSLLKPLLRFYLPYPPRPVLVFPCIHRPNPTALSPTNCENRHGIPTPPDLANRGYTLTLRGVGFESMLSQRRQEAR